MPEAAANPGSFSQFVETSGIDPTAADAIYRYSDALAEYRNSLSPVIELRDPTPRVNALLFCKVLTDAAEVIPI